MAPDWAKSATDPQQLCACSPPGSRLCRSSLLYHAAEFTLSPQRQIEARSQPSHDQLRSREDFTVLSLIKELAAYMSARKKWWLLPVIMILLVVGGMLMLAQGSALAPFIYTVF